MGARRLGSEGGLSAKVQRFCRGNGARIGVGNACNRSVNLPRHKGGSFWKGYEHGSPVLGTCFDLYRATVKRCNLPNKR